MNDPQSLQPSSPDAPNLPAESAAPESSGRVVVIGWQVLLIPLVVLAVIGGYWVGRQLRAEPAPVADTAAAPAPAGGEAVLALDANSAGAPIVVTMDPSAFGGGTDLGFGSDPVPLPPAMHPLIGQAAPDFTVKRLGTGEEVALSSLRGKTVVMNFWATWCPPCIIEMPWIETAHQKYGEQGVEIMAIDAGERVPPSMVEERVQQFVDRMGLSFPVYWGDNTYDIQRDYGVYGLPSTFIVDPEGKVIDYHNGVYPNEATLHQQIELALQGGEAGAAAPADAETGG